MSAQDDILSDIDLNEYKKPKAEALKDGIIKSFKAHLIGIGSLLILIILGLTAFITILLDGGIELKDLGFTAIVIMCCSYSYYLLQFDKGKLEGKKTESHVKAMERYTALKTKLLQKDSAVSLEKYCTARVDDELKSAREKLLKAYELSYEEYIKNYVELSPKEIKKRTDIKEPVKELLIKVNAMKPLSLSASMLVNEKQSEERETFVAKPIKGRLRYLKAKKFVTCIFFAVFGGFVAVTLIFNFSVTGVIKAAVQIIFTILGGIFGYRDGYEIFAVDFVEYKNSQSDLLEGYFNSKGERISSPEVKENEEPTKQN